jgi:hypothetical protein
VSFWNGQKRASFALRKQCDVWPTAVTRVPSETVMKNSKEKAAEFRRQAAISFDLAQRISLKEDQERMMQVAEHWLELAKRAEAEAD